MLAKKYKTEQKKTREKWNILRDLDAFPEKDMLGGAHTEIFGNSKINVDGCLGVFEYRDTYLKLKLQKGVLILCGSGFDIVFYEEQLISIKGKISSVEFCV